MGSGWVGRRVDVTLEPRSSGTGPRKRGTGGSKSRSRHKEEVTLRTGVKGPLLRFFCRKGSRGQHCLGGHPTITDGVGKCPVGSKRGRRNFKQGGSLTGSVPYLLVIFYMHQKGRDVDVLLDTSRGRPQDLSKFEKGKSLRTVRGWGH